MSDTSDQQPNEEGGIAALREAARRGADAIKENQLLARKVLFLEAGVDLSNELGEMLFKTWEGDDVKELVEKATRIGALKAPATPPPPAADPAAEAAARQRAEEDARRQAMYDSTAGAPPAPAGGAEGDHPRDAALAQYREDLTQGVPADEARIDAMAKVLAAGARGDKRVVFDYEAHNARGREADRLANTRS